MVMTQGIDPSERSGEIKPDDLAIDVLGRCPLPSPVSRHLGERGGLERVVFAVFGEDARRAFEAVLAEGG